MYAPRLSDLELSLLKKENEHEDTHHFHRHSFPEHPEAFHAPAEQYDPDKIPADLDLAQNHGLACRVYDQNAAKPNADDARCPCCNNPIGGEELDLFCDLDSLFYLGNGYVLYFKFLKYCIYILFSVFCISGIYNLTL